MRYSIVGLGKLGASMAAAIASRGFEVIGVDVNQRSIDLVNAGHAPVEETGLEALTAANRDRIRATRSHVEAIVNSDVTFVIVPTPSDEKGAFSLQYAAWAFKEIAHGLAKKKQYHVVVLTSTVLPGSTRCGLLPILEKESGKICGRDFGLCYSPEFIALGSVIRDFLNPDFTLIGQFDDKAGAILEQAYAEIMLNRPPCKRMTLENAELTKISINSFVTTKITFANMLVDLCERIPGGNIDVVTDAVGADRRVGSAYLKGSIGYGGPCFPRDNMALAYLAGALESRADLAETTDRMNRSLPERFMKRLRSFIRRGTTVAVLGLAYKPDSHVIEESQGVELAWALFKAGARVVVYDPLAKDAAQSEFRGHILVLDSVADCLAQAEMVLITTADPIFRKLKSEDFTVHSKIITVVDFWRILDKELSDSPGIRYVPVGRSVDDAANSARLHSLWDDAVEWSG